MKEIVTIQLQRKSSTPLYMQLSWHLKRLIKEGVLKGGDRLPSIRDLARELGVNNVTVINAYRELEKEGLAYSRIGSGTYIAGLERCEQQEKVSDGIDDLESMEKGQVPIKTEAINFASTSPAADLFPVQHFKQLINRVLDRDRGNAFGYTEIQGYRPLRQSIRAYLENYSINVSLDSIQVISGAQQGIDIVSKALVDYGDCIFVENPTYRGALEAFRSRGAKIIGIPMQEDGIDLEELERKIALHKPRIIYIMPSFQNPTGYTYSEEKKKRILDIVENYNILLVEDDFLSELGFKDRVLPLKAFDSQERVVYIKSFSKIFMPGLRLGFMVVPPRLSDRILIAKHISDISTSGFIQRTFDLYLREGFWAEHIEYMRGIYRERYELFIRAVEEKFPEEIEYKRPDGGLHMWFALPKGYSSNELYNLCLKENVLITPGSLFFVEGTSQRHFRMSFAGVHLEQIEEGVVKVGHILEKYMNNPPSPQYGVEGYAPFL